MAGLKAPTSETGSLMQELQVVLIASFVGGNRWLMIKSLLTGFALLACASAEAAEAWNCTYVRGISEAVLVRFEVSPP